MQCARPPKRPDGMKFDPPDRMRRFVQAKLTRTEIDSLRTLLADLGVKQVWSNARKRTMVHISAATVQATTANLGYGASGPQIGWTVLDTGIDAQHPRFAAHRNVRAQWDCLGAGAVELQATANASVRADGNGHGTHVAGIIAGRSETVEPGGGALFEIKRGDPAPVLRVIVVDTCLHSDICNGVATRQ